MKAIKVELILPDDGSAEYFITQVLPKLKEEHGIVQAYYHGCEYFEK